MPARDAAITQADYQALADFRRELRRFLSFSEEVTHAAGLEPQQHQLLLAIKGAEPAEIAINDVADRLQLKHHSAVELVNRAEERGLVQRVRDEADRRKVMVRLTGLGEDNLRHLALYHLEELRLRGPDLIAALSRVVANNRGEDSSAGAGAAERNSKMGVDLRE